MKERIVSLAWGLSGVVALIGILAWYQSLAVPVSKLTIYDIFPAFGITAFSVMWSHYAVGALREYLKVDKARFITYFRLTSYVVLVCLLLHPGLLIWQLQRDAAGLPFDYVAPDERLYLVFGMVAWLAFLIYELHRFYAERRWWRYVTIAGDVAMVLVLIHGFMLSTALMPLWFTALWVMYGLSLGLLFAYGRHRRWKVAQ